MWILLLLQDGKDNGTPSVQKSVVIKSWDVIVPLRCICHSVLILCVWYIYIVFNNILYCMILNIVLNCFIVCLILFAPVFGFICMLLRWNVFIAVCFKSWDVIVPFRCICHMAEVLILFVWYIYIVFNKLFYIAWFYILCKCFYCVLDFICYCVWF